MKFENTTVSNFQNAFRGMRNPLASWKRSDSAFGLSHYDNMPEYEIAFAWVEATNPGIAHDTGTFEDFQELYAEWLRNNILSFNNKSDIVEYAFIGPNDMDLAMRLCNAGPEHRKFLRQIQVCVDITAPLYWWKEADTYKVGTTANSTSTMHKLASTPITLNCFEIDDYDEDLAVDQVDQSNITEAGKESDFIAHWHMDIFTNHLLKELEDLRVAYNTTKDKRYWKELVRWLPNGWLQTRTVTMNYENLRSICTQRRGHKLIEWEAFINWATTLPYADQLIFGNPVNID